MSDVKREKDRILTEYQTLISDAASGLEALFPGRVTSRPGLPMVVKSVNHAEGTFDVVRSPTVIHQTDILLDTTVIYTVRVFREGTSIVVERTFLGPKETLQ